ncbi:MAG TPA: DNA repair protein RadC [Polyangiaceae bacterium]|nr:DNA repair protein RadC [Polyangiaceae bacterium]
MPQIRERALESGVQDLGDAELLTLLLGTGSAGHSVERVALALLEAAGGIEGIARLGPHAFAVQPGVGPVKAARLAAALELGRRVLIRSLAEQRQIIDSFEAAADWARPRLAALDHEEVWLLCLDGRSGLKSSTRIAQGGLHGAALTARDVLAPAVKNGAAAILLVHNHPSGDPQPSPDDIDMTRHVAKCAELIGIPLLDHVVVARQGARSIFDEQARGGTDVGEGGAPGRRRAVGR